MVNYPALYNPNCFTQEITLYKEEEDGPILSPFGTVTNDSTANYAFHNDLTIVWKRYEAEHQPCTTLQWIWSSYNAQLTVEPCIEKEETQQWIFDFLFTHEADKAPARAVPEEYKRRPLPGSTVYPKDILWDTFNAFAIPILQDTCCISQEQPNRNIRWI